jgi:hypothetical protein
MIGLLWQIASVEDFIVDAQRPPFLFSYRINQAGARQFVNDSYFLLPAINTTASSVFFCFSVASATS